APAGLIASETLRSEIAGIHQAIDNSQRAGNVVNTAEGALSEVSSLLLEVQGLTNQAANTGALSPEEIKANQLQVDAILHSANRMPGTMAIAGNDGTEQLSFAASTHNSAIAIAVNQIKGATGVSAVLSGGALRLTSTSYGAKQFVSVSTLTGTFLNGKDYGQDA